MTQAMKPHQKKQTIKTIKTTESTMVSAKDHCQINLKAIPTLFAYVQFHAVFRKQISLNLSKKKLAKQFKASALHLTKRNDLANLIRHCSMLRSHGLCCPQMTMLSKYRNNSKAKSSMTPSSERMLWAHPIIKMQS